MGSIEPVQSKGVAGASRLFTRRRVVVVACLIALAAIALLLLLRPGRSADARLQAIDAAHAVPDEQNAGKDYTLLVLNGTGAFLDPQLLAQNVWTATLAQPWRSADLPDAAKWVQERQVVIDTLLQIGRKPKCWFPLSVGDKQSGKRFQVAYYGGLLLQAANNDFAEGRTEAGMEKLLCVFSMAEHFRSQMSLSDHDTGMFLASEGLKSLNRLLVTEEVPQAWLTKLDAALPQLKDTGDKERRRLHEIEGMRVRKELGVRMRILYTFTGRSRSTYWRRMDLAHLAEFRAGRILLALRRHKDQTGAWPATLTEIEDQIPSEALIDPLTKKPFAYRPGGDSLILYNVGPNGIDEGGASGDDYTFWPLSGYWPGRNR